MDVISDFEVVDTGELTGVTLFDESIHDERVRSSEALSYKVDGDDVLFLCSDSGDGVLRLLGAGTSSLLGLRNELTLVLVSHSGVVAFEVKARQI